MIDNESRVNKIEPSQRSIAAACSSQDTTTQPLIADGGQRIISVCPHCDGANIYRRNANPAGSHRQSDHQYHCRNCTEGFDEPAERPAKSSQSPRPSGNAPIAQALYDTDKDRIGGDA